MDGMTESVDETVQRSLLLDESGNLIGESLPVGSRLRPSFRAVGPTLGAHVALIAARCHTVGRAPDGRY